jgi:hypothetical protein
VEHYALISRDTFEAVQAVLRRKDARVDFSVDSANRWSEDSAV